MSSLDSLTSNSTTSELMEDAAVFIATVSALVIDDLVEQVDEGGKRALDDFRVDGLMRGLAIVAGALAGRGAWLKSEVEGEALTALARRQGKTTLDGTNVRNAS